MAKDHCKLKEKTRYLKLKDLVLFCVQEDGTESLGSLTSFLWDAPRSLGGRKFSVLLILSLCSGLTSAEGCSLMLLDGSPSLPPEFLGLTASCWRVAIDDGYDILVH